MKYKFEDIIFNITEKKKPVEEDKYNYIGLEHLESGNLFISKWGSDTAPEGEKIVMKKGDVLFGKRRAYQKKVAISPIDGIFSAHGMVLRPKEDVICKEFLPFFISSEAFLNEAIRISVGGLSPTVNWKDIRELEFDLPPLAEQKVLAEKLWAAYEVKQSYLKMIDATEEMVKAQFVEMFGTINTPQGKLITLGNLCNIQRGGSPRPIKDYITNDSNGINWIKIGDTDESMYITKTEEKIKPSGLNKTRQVYAGDLLLSNSMSFGKPYILKIDGCIHDGWLVLHINDESVLTQIYLCAYLSQKSTYMAMSKLASGGVVQNLNSEIVKSLPVILPPIQKQKEYIALLDQADKSISELRKSVDAIDKVIKSLINENL